MAVNNPSAPVLATVPGVELGSVGFWDISNADDWHPSADQLAAAIAALDCPAVRRPVLKFGHTGESGEGDPAIGLVDNMRLTEDGQTLVGDFVGMPGWLAEADSEGRCVLASAYPDRSGEWQNNYVCQLGHTHPFVLHAVALLGVKRPGIGTLQSLFDLYTTPPEKEVAVAKATVALAGTTIDQVRNAYYDGPGSNYLLWIREMFINPPELIVCNDADDSMQRVPYTVSGDGNVDFGDGQAVKVEYINAMAGVQKPAVVYTSAAEARPGNVTNRKDTMPNTTDVAAASADSDEDSSALIASLDATLDAAAKLAAPIDRASVTPDVGQVLDLVVAAEALVDQLMDLVGVYDPDDDDSGASSSLASSGSSTPTKASKKGPSSMETETEPTLDKVAASAKKLGQRLIDEAQADQLIADAAAGREALKQITSQRHDQIVSAAIGDGKIPPSRKAHYMGLMERDPEGTEKFLAEAPKEAAVPITEMGHSTEPVTEVADDPRYQEWKF